MHKVSCEAARDRDIVIYLESLGILPQKIRGNSYWYLSPLRIEKTASFKIDRKLNRWYDFGLGQGGNLIDFGTLYFRCSVSDFLSGLSNGSTSFPGPDLAIATIPDTRIKISNTKPLSHPALLHYISSRKIAHSLAFQYCNEVDFDIGNKKYFAIGFVNKLGGYELRNKFFKGSNSPKTVTWFKTGNVRLSVFEGFFDFLSFLSLQPTTVSNNDFLVLNSLAFFEGATEEILHYDEVHLYLDNNPAGKNCTSSAIERNSKFQDRSFLYTGFEDLNDFLCKGHRFPDGLKDMPEKPP
ncbi:toprim domain-containing protein [Pedobacter jeongneungensis]|uniref:toprim domain-containing protein n=1 Tax=Pedobacter jeongneungensis TaxID=947309 RepID=UPI000A0711AC|nr:toprim domain-containing protein [Pedobacter jeongneungensis]